MNEVNRLIREKDEIVNLLSIDVFKGAEEWQHKAMRTLAFAYKKIEASIMRTSRTSTAEAGNATHRERRAT